MSVGADGDGFDVCRDEWGMRQKSYSRAGLYTLVWYGMVY